MPTFKYQINDRVKERQSNRIHGGYINKQGTHKLIKTRKGNLKKIIGSLNQQYVFNRQKKPSYARKMKTVMNIVRKRLGKKKDGK